MADGDVANINLLIGEMKSNDTATRIAALKRLSLVALALGPERARNELVNFLNESIDEEDEVLVVMAEEFGNFVDFVGGPDYASCLLPPLEKLAQIEETVVRDQAVQSLKTICGKLGDGAIKDHFVPMVLRLSTGEWFTSKISACGLIPTTCQRASDTDAEALRQTFKELTLDDSPMVRRAASCNLTEFAKSVPADKFSDTLISIFLKLAQDDQDSVRLLVVENCVGVAQVVGPQETTNSVLPTFKDCAVAKSWRVRYMVAEHSVAFAKCLDPARLPDLVDVFATLLYKDHESEAEVRTAAAKRVTEFATLLPASVVIEKILPAVESLAHDSSQHVRAALSSVVTGLAPICGKEETLSTLVPFFLQLLKDEIPEVRLNIISSLEDVNKVIGVETLATTLFPAITELSADKQWRVRLAIIEYIPLLAEQLGVELFDDKLKQLCFLWLGDCVFTVREAAINNLKRLAMIFGQEWAVKEIVPQLNQIKKHTNYLYRMTTLFLVTALSDVVGSEVVCDALLPIALELATDPVPNIRFNVCKTLSALIPVVDPNVAGAKIKPTLHKLMDDKEDADVKHFATKAHELLGTS